MMFDFQTLRYSSPMVDFITYTANSTGVDVRGPNFERMFKVYHDSLISSFCKGANLDEESVPDFLRCAYAHMKYVHIIGYFSLHLATKE